MKTIDLSGKTALVTGGSRGIGRAVCEMLGQAGARVAVNFRRDERAAEEVVAGIRASGGEARAIGADVSAPEQARRLVDEVVAAWKRLDIVVNNAAIWEEDEAGGVNLEIWRRTLDTNVLGSFLVTDAAMRELERNKGSIVFVSSTAGQRGEARHSAYASSKGAIISYTKSLAAELGPRGVRVNCVAPGWVETDMTRDTMASAPDRREIESSIPLGRVGQPEEIAGAVLFLVSDLASFVQGEILNVNGASVLAG